MSYKKNYKKTNKKFLRKTPKKNYSKNIRHFYQAPQKREDIDAAFYAGVGYGKSLNGSKWLGFNSNDAIKSFEHGMASHDHYFNAYGNEPKGLFSRIISFFKRKK